MAPQVDQLLRLLANSRVTASQVAFYEKSRAQASLGRKLFKADDPNVVERWLRHGADVWQRDSAGNVPLHVASKEVAHLLLEECGDAAGVRNFKGQTAVRHLISLGWEVALRIPLSVLLSEELDEEIEEAKRGDRTQEAEEDLPTRKKVIDRILGPLAPSSEEFSHALEDIHRFSFLCKHLPPGLEGPVLFHLISKATFSTQVLQEKLQTMICQLFHKHGQELKLGLTPAWSQFASWLLEALTRWAEVSPELPCSFAMWVVDNVEELHKSLTRTRFFLTRTLSGDRSPKSEKNDLSWLFLGARTLDQSAMRNDFVPQGETLDFFDIFHYMRCETEEDLREAATEMQTRFVVFDNGERHFSVAEELVLALREVQGVKDVTCLQVSAAWLHCAQLWHRCCQAESEAVGQVVRLLNKSQVPFSHLKRMAIPSLDALWQRALSLWPHTTAEPHLPGVFLCDILACECELPSATAVRALHHFLLRLTFREGAELMWTSATGAGLLDRSGLQEGLLLKTSAGPVFLQLRILLSPGVDANALDFFKTLEIGGFLPLQFRSLWVRWLQLELSLRRAVESKSSSALKAAIDQACQELEKDGLKAFAGAWLDRIEELSKLLKHWLKNERRAEEDLADDLEYRAEMAEMGLAPQQCWIDVAQLAENRLMYWRQKMEIAA